MKKILVVGGSGFVGKALTDRLKRDGYDPLIFSRGNKPVRDVTVVTPDAQGYIPADVMDALHGIVNLAGETVAQRWTRGVKERILSSRIETTNAVIAALERNRSFQLRCPQVLVNASAVGYYGNSPQGIQTEASPSGAGFLAKVCREWEKSARQAEDLGLRVVILRFGIVLGPDGGVLEQMLKPFNWRVGGVIGDGSQYISWVHREDLTRAASIALGDETMVGPYNLTSPHPVTMDWFMHCLGYAVGRASWTRMPGFVARILFGEMADEILLASQEVLPQRLLQQGFAFSWGELEQALADIFSAR